MGIGIGGKRHVEVWQCVARNWAGASAKTLEVLGAGRQQDGDDTKLSPDHVEQAVEALVSGTFWRR
ncbi:hypothetical protein GCM10009103_33100 [Pseudomonas koreensis]|nr:hypothetical protein GCM10009103_33100 [Pseudomonas koreensis]